jgi:hypothetical protein
MLHIMVGARLFVGRTRVSAARRLRGHVRHQSFLEALEDRTVLSTLTVFNNADSGPGSLRDRISAANSGDTIVFDPSLAGQTITLTSGQLVIAQSLDIENTLPGPVSISGNNSSRIFDIVNGNVTIDGLSIVNGYAGASGSGGGILNLTGLTISNCTFANNSALFGGGITNDGTLTVSNSSLSNNVSSNGQAGGILNYNGGTATIRNSTITNNTAFSGGGGILNLLGTLTVSNSTITDNNAPSGDGGGINNNNGGMLIVSNSTIANNTGYSGGGGITNYGTATVSNSTIANNTANFNGGGGIRNNSGGSVTAFDTIISGNTGDGAPDISGALTSQGHNLIGNTSGGSGFATSDLLNRNPLLAPLGNYGGTTQTIALLPGSPAIDAGDNTNASTTDQRSFSRIVNGTIDIGAFESRGFTITIASGDDQSTAVGRPFAAPLVVTVTSPTGEPVQGGVVTLTAPDSGPSGTFGRSTTATGTIATNGQVSEAFTSNLVAGSYSVTATAAGVSPPASFSLTNFQPVPTNAIATGGGSALINHAFNQPLVVKYIDQNGDPVPNVPVFFTAPSSGASGTFSNGSTTILAVSDINGQVSEAFTANASVGNYSVFASVFSFFGFSSVAQFFLTNTTLTVLNTNDNGPGSLRDAIQNASNNDRIVFDPSLAGQTITLTSGALEINKNLDIEDNLSSPVSISGNNASSVLSIGPGATVTLNGLNIVNGNASFGGGILNHGSLAINNSTIAGNTAAADGGGMFNYGTLTLNNSTFSNNTALFGCGITNFGMLTVSNSTFSNNTSSNGYAGVIFNNNNGAAATVSNSTLTDNTTGGIVNGGMLTVSNSIIDSNAAPQGGGIDNYGTLTVSDSTIAGNTATSGGGGIINSGTATVSNSTIANNTANFNGGGGIDNTGTVTINDSTIANNSAHNNGVNNGGGGINNPPGGTVTIRNSTIAGDSAEEGGGITNGGTLTAFDTIMAGNSASLGPDVLGTLISQGHNLIGNTSGGSGFAASDLLSLNPLLAPLGNHGGPTQTMALLPGSPAIDAGDNTNAPATDQRGFNRIVNGTIDIGAFESSGFTIAAASGNDQSAVANASFAPLVVTVTSAFGEPVQGGVVIFAANPSSNGAGPTFPSGITATINSSAQASVSMNANAVAGTYFVAATSSGVAAGNGAVFEETNTDLQSVINAPPAGPVTLLVNDPSQENAVLGAVDSLTAPPSPVMVNAILGSAIFDDALVSVPAGVTLNLVGNGTTTTIVGNSPALTVLSGNATAQGITFTTSTASPTILVTGGSLVLRDNTIEESTGFAQAALLITGGHVDLGTSATDPGGNIFNVNGTGSFIQNTSGSPIPAAGDTFENNGVTAPSIIVLDPTTSGALTLDGNASLNFPGVVVVDSSSPTAISASGKAEFSALATGLTMPDPFAGLSGPPTLNMTCHGAEILSGSAQATIPPGIYSQINVSGKSSLTLCPGIYIIEGGGLTVTGSASITGNGVLIYNAGSNYPNPGGNFGGITLSGSGTINLSAPGSDGLYPGIVIFQSRQNTRALSFSGNAMAGMTGTIYAPNALLSLSGNAQLQASLDVGMLNVSGNAALTQTAAGSDGIGDTSGIANTLLAGNLAVYVDDPSGEFTSDERARIQDAINAWDAVLAPYSVTITQVNDPGLANIVIDTGSTSACGGVASGVLGCFNAPAGEITLIQGWNWYAGSDPSQIGPGQYDFETTVLHELGHALGLGGATNPSSPMFETLAPGTTHRIVTAQDLHIPDPPAAADPLSASGLPKAILPAAPLAVSMPDPVAAALRTVFVAVPATSVAPAASSMSTAPGSSGAPPAVGAPGALIVGPGPVPQLSDIMPVGTRGFWIDRTIDENTAPGVDGGADPDNLPRDDGLAFGQTTPIVSNSLLRSWDDAIDAYVGRGGTAARSAEPVSQSPACASDAIVSTLDPAPLAAAALALWGSWEVRSRQGGRRRAYLRRVGLN